MQDLAPRREQGTPIAKSTDAVLKKMRGLIPTIVVLGVLFGMLMAVNPRMRERASEMTVDVQNQKWNSTGGPIATFAETVADTTSWYASDNPVMFSFVFVAVVLFILMLRT